MKKFFILSILAVLFISGCSAQQQQRQSQIVAPILVETKIDKQDAEKIVNSFWENLSQDKFEQAYSLLGAAFQSKIPFEKWKAGYENTPSQKLELASCNNGICTANVTAVETDNKTTWQTNYTFQYDLAFNADGLLKIEKAKVLDQKKLTTDAKAEIKDFLDKLDVTVQSISEGDINKNGIKDYLVDGLNKGCGSCHSRPLYLFESGRVAFKYEGDDYEVIKAENNYITVKEPIRLANEPLCCPSSFEITTIYCPTIDSDSYCKVGNTYPEIKTPEPASIVPAVVAPNGTYTNTAGNEVARPYAAPTKPVGASAQCRDGTYSFSQSRRGTCSGHGGVAIWY